MAENIPRIVHTRFLPNHDKHSLDGLRTLKPRFSPNSTCFGFLFPLPSSFPQCNRIHSGLRSGIVVLGNGKGSIRSNQIYGNKEAGVYILFNGNPVVR